jgi:hypothetical protein|tara:strand:+ start:186 stop:506 length:321 start_codon:yes stop_codon:yes gene_type:complete
MNRFLYFNTSASDESDVLCIPAKQVVGLDVDANTTIELYFNDLGSADTNDGIVVLTVDAGTTKEVAEAIVKAINFSTDPFIVVGDDFQSEYIHPNLTAVGAITLQA